MAKKKDSLPPADLAAMQAQMAASQSTLASLSVADNPSPKPVVANSRVLPMSNEDYAALRIDHSRAETEFVSIDEVRKRILASSGATVPAGIETHWKMSRDKRDKLLTTVHEQVKLRKVKS